MLEYLGINFADGKFTFSTTAMYAAISTSIVITGIVLILSFRRSCRIAEEQQKQQKRSETESLLPQLWLTAFDECKLFKGYKSRKIWFRTWLNKVDQSKLAKLSMLGAAKFATMVAKSSTDDDFDNAMDELSTFIIFPGELMTETAAAAAAKFWITRDLEGPYNDAFYMWSKKPMWNEETKQYCSKGTLKQSALVSRVEENIFDGLECARIAEGHMLELSVEIIKEEKNNVS